MDGSAQDLHSQPPTFRVFSVFTDQEVAESFFAPIPDLGDDLF
jgi:hypothetical protein